MSYVRTIDHKGRRIILLDFSGLVEPSGWTAAVAEAKRFFSALPPDGSALTLTDVSGTRYNRDTVDALKALTAGNAPYVKAGAVVNTSTMHRAVIGMIALFARRKFSVFETRDQAMAWLSTQ